MTRQVIVDAFDSSLPEFEDNIQIYSAKEMQADYVIQQEIPVVTPEEFLHLIGILK